MYILVMNAMYEKYIHIGSISIIKEQAVRKVFNQYVIKTYNVDSEVSSQPVGFEEIERGASNRANNIDILYQQSDQKGLMVYGILKIGIENGLIKLNNQWYDLACIKFITPRKIYTSWTAMVPIYNYDGDGKNYTQSKDPHLELTGISRTIFLEQAIQVVYNIYELDLKTQIA